MNVDAAHPQLFQSPGHGSASTLKSDRDLLHGYIYDYLIKQQFPESAKVFFKEAEVVSNGKTTSVILGFNSSGNKMSTSPTSASNENASASSSSGSNNDAGSNNESSTNGVSSNSSTNSTPRPFSSQDPSRKPTVNGNPSRNVSYIHLKYIFMG